MRPRKERLNLQKFLKLEVTGKGHDLQRVNWISYLGYGPEQLNGKVEESPMVTEEFECIERLERKKSKLIFMEFKLAAGSAPGDAVREVREP